jgi:Phage terminase large subunit (GpA)
VLIAYRGSHDISGVWRRGTDQTAHARLVQGNSNLLKDVLAARLSIETPGPGFLHFSAAPDAGFDAEFFEQLLSERRERRKTPRHDRHDLGSGSRTKRSFGFVLPVHLRRRNIFRRTGHDGAANRDDR